jgi:fructose-bisphosphate aldolase class I
MNVDGLNKTALAIVSAGKGILAADESTPTIKKRFDTIGVESTETNRKNYRNMLFSTDGVSKYISGVILFDETIRQKSPNGTPMVDVLAKAGIIPGIKVDKGAKPLANSASETVTEGLDGLRERCQDYVSLGAKFAKWRAVIKLGSHIPSEHCISVNAHALARYASLCQEAGLVPIVEPEVLMDGSHDINQCEMVTENTLKALYHELHKQHVVLEGTLLKPNMIISGSECTQQAGVDEVAERTVACLKRSVPAAVPGVVFLSGGQPDKNATLHLNSMNANSMDLPWKLSFSYGRALQEAPLKAWRGSDIEGGKQAFFTRAKANGEACLGIYK